MSWFRSSPPLPAPRDDAELSSSGFSETIPEFDAVPETTAGTNDTLQDAAAPETPAAPKIRTIEDLRRLNRRATQNGMYAGVLGGGVLVGGTGISFLTTRSIINNTLGEHYAQLRAAQAARTGNMLNDKAIGDTHQPLEEEVDPRVQLARDLSNIGAPRERTRWTKGRGLEGEVEEEDELRDTYHRPGVPRNA
ncbi:hypothetical protein CspeluHIS016_0205040 [Cutaneotrichosporon spelunceum]|uniref:Uncharacterized protein n=1 Tax=Cutaneotrichosporon spelunceum TaxID=1672016 RepID=A0AAD3YAW1_9TREE|nr:hypothetical protein CspeluHIS016_0205040 [Cutaneotrichosporon spelunceum]